MAYQISKPAEEVNQPAISQVIETPTTVEATVEPVAPIVETVQPSTVTVDETVSSATPTAPVVTRTFDQIIIDYPNMSDSDIRLSCSAYIRDTFAYRFTPDVIEQNIKLVSDRFVDSCTAVGSNPRNPKPNLLGPGFGLGDFWERFKS